MHPEARHFILKNRLDLPRPPVSILEVGSRNINGGVSDLFRGAGPYWGIDLLPGPGVDQVISLYNYPNLQTPAPFNSVDLIICCEVLEHDPRWFNFFGNAHGLLRNSNSKVLVTTAGISRAPHSGIDGGPLRVGEHYRNFEASQLVASAYPFFERILVESGRNDEDVYMVASRPRLKPTPESPI